MAMKLFQKVLTEPPHLHSDRISADVSSTRGGVARRSRIATKTDKVGETIDGESITENLRMGMKRGVIFATVLAVIAGEARAQISLSRPGQPFLTVDQLVAVVGSDSEVAEIISQALAYQVRVFRLESIVVIGAQIREN